MKGAISCVRVVWNPTVEYGVATDWAVEFAFQSPTGDESDFIYRQIPCVNHAQAVAIADRYNAEVCPEFVGAYAEEAVWGVR